MDNERIAAMLDKTFAWAVTRTFSREEAEELTQEILCQALGSIHELRDKTKFYAWFWRLAEITRKVYKRGKANQRATLSFNEITTVTCENEPDFFDQEEIQALRQRIAQLSATYRDILVLYYYDDLPCKTIAQQLGLPEGTVTYRLSLARNKLKERCNHMNETALKPVQLRISITGEGNYNGHDIPFPSQYINDALSQNILWYAYRTPKTVEELSALTGAPAYFIEERIENLLQREAVIRPTKNTVQTDFLIFDKTISQYAPAHVGGFVDAVSERFYTLSRQMTDALLTSGLPTAGRSVDEILCLLSVMLLDHAVTHCKPVPYSKPSPKYDGHRWSYTGFMQGKSFADGIGIGIEKSMNNYESGKLAHYTYHFAPFAYRRMMYSNEMDVCKAIVDREPLTNVQKETAASLLAQGVLEKNKDGETICTIPVFTKDQHAHFLTLGNDLFTDFWQLYTEQIQAYLRGYSKLFPRHLKEAANRNGFYVFVAMFKAIVSDWLAAGKISVADTSVCDVLICQ